MITLTPSFSDVNITGYTCTELDIYNYYYVSSYENEKIAQIVCVILPQADEWQHICIGYSPGWRQLWAYNTRKIIGQGRSPRQLSQGCYMPITASKQGYMYFIPW